MCYRISIRIDQCDTDNGGLYTFDTVHNMQGDKADFVFIQNIACLFLKAYRYICCDIIYKNKALTIMDFLSAYHAYSGFSNFEDAMPDYP